MEVIIKTEALTEAGRSFDVSFDSTIAIDATAYMLTKIGDIHMHFSGFLLKCDKGKLLIELFENPTISNNGTPLTPVNRNRSALYQAQSKVYTSPTITSDGTRLAVRSVLDVGGGAHTLGGEVGNVGEWILKPNNNYIVKLTNLSGVEIAYTVSYFFTEPQQAE